MYTSERILSPPDLWTQRTLSQNHHTFTNSASQASLIHFKVFFIYTNFALIFNQNMYEHKYPQFTGKTCLILSHLGFAGFYLCNMRVNCHIITYECMGVRKSTLRNTYHLYQTLQKLKYTAVPVATKFII